eukprot:8518283-Alexandrium_andersonii.AAC.1
MACAVSTHLHPRMRLTGLRAEKEWSPIILRWMTPSFVLRVESSSRSLLPSGRVSIPSTASRTHWL